MSGGGLLVFIILSNWGDRDRVGMIEHPRAGIYSDPRGPAPPQSSANRRITNHLVETPNRRRNRRSENEEKPHMKLGAVLDLGCRFTEVRMKPIAVSRGGH